MIDERIAERRAAVRDDHRRDRLRRTWWALGLLGLLGVLVAVERSPLVALEEVTVAGVERLEPEEVIAAADLEVGTSTLRLGLRAASERVEELPLVREASARRIDPLSVELEVEERRPELVVVGGGQRRYLDRDGIVIDDVGPGEEPLDVWPVIELATEPPVPGERVDDDAALANAHVVWRGLSGSLRAETVRYRAAGPDELTLELASGVEVRFGRAERVDEKVRALGAVLEDVGDTPVETIDVRAPSAPVVIGR